MDWLALSIEVPRDRAERAEQTLEECGALAVTLSDAGDAPVLETAPGETPLWPSVRLTGMYARGTDPDGVRQALAAALDDEGTALESVVIADREWTRAWMDRFGPMRFGERLWIVPRQAAEPGNDGVFVRLDPGLAFGTGTHATTALCLEWLDAHPVEGARVVDYGCGSGILGIAAAKLGAESVWCVDHDRQALAATRENAGVNGVADRIHACLPGSMPALQADIVLANILFKPLVGLAGNFASLCAPRGRLVLSGILEGQARDLIDAYRGDFTDFEVTAREGWSMVSARR